MIRRWFTVLSLSVSLLVPLFSMEKAAASAKVKADLLAKFGEKEKFRIERGVDQVAELWRTEDGSSEEFAAYCLDYFVPAGPALESAFKKIEYYTEIIGGFFGQMDIEKKQPVDLDWGEITPIDMAMAQFNPGAHLSEDLFQNKLAFFSLLNFPAYTLNEKMTLAPQWNRKAWAIARTGGTNNVRIPPEVNQKVSTALTTADRYISEYNICMGRLVDERLRTYFPADMKLISHWGIRDELKARYADPAGLAKQKLIYQVMERIIRQEIPAAVVNSDKVQWNPYSNDVYENGKKIVAPAEGNERYRHFLDVFQAMRLVDPHSPKYPTHILRRFDTGREILEKDVEALFVELLSSPQAKKVGRLIEKRLRRKLLPLDIWYPNFKASSGIPEEELDKIVARKYPTREAFEQDIPAILRQLGFSAESVAYLAPKIQVDPSRGAGHSTSSGSREFKVRLRSRIPAAGMNYKGYNIAIHELGHAVETVLDLHKIDYYSLAGVPNIAFTEAFAYVFQDRCYELLGIQAGNPQAWELKALDSFWSAYEIMGVSLLDMHVWHWLYDHPQATPPELKEAVIRIAKDIWNRFFAPVFGIGDQDILAIYSHMIDSALYLPDYPLGHVIQFQIEDYLRGKVIGPEMERMCAAGNILPQIWMKNAVGSEISVQPLLEAVERALKIVK